MELNPEQVKELKGPCVYMFWRNGTCVYVGSTNYGLGRPFASNHRILRKYDGLSLTVVPMPDMLTAYEEEIKLIGNLKPEYNTLMKKDLVDQKPRAVGVIRGTEEYAEAIDAMANGENTMINVLTIPKIVRPVEALLQALRRYMRKGKLPYDVYARGTVVYVRKKKVEQSQS